MFRPFQFLYQTFKGTDQRLFDTFERIHMALEELFAGANDVVSSKGTGELELKTFFQDVPGLNISIKKQGTWLVLVNLECLHIASDGQIEFLLTANGITQPGTGIVFNSTDTIISSASKFWVFRMITKSSRLQVRARIASDAAAGSKILGNDIVAIWQNSDV